LPNEFLAGFSAAAGIALINSIVNLGGFVGPYAMGAISRRTGSLDGGLVFVRISLFLSAMLILALQTKTENRREETFDSATSPAAEINKMASPGASRSLCDIVFP
jgi:ACS family tartrate transporter-like MFS transporter